MSLLDSLVGAWELDEASGNALDSHSTGYDLTETGDAIGTGTGLVHANARDFESIDLEYFTIADNADLSAGDRDFTFEGWFNAEGFVNYPIILSKGWNSATATNREYVVWVDVADNNLVFSVYDGTSAVDRKATNFGALSTATWYHFVAYHDSVNNVIGIIINNGTANTTAHTTGVQNGAAGFVIGASIDQGLYWDGLLGPIRRWNRMLTSTEITDLYNSGSGLAYADFSSSTSIKTWNGLADASTKTWNGLARASVKTFNGLA